MCVQRMKARQEWQDQVGSVRAWHAEAVAMLQGNHMEEVARLRDEHLAALHSARAAGEAAWTQSQERHERQVACCHPLLSWLPAQPGSHTFDCILVLALTFPDILPHAHTCKSSAALTHSHREFKHMPRLPRFGRIVNQTLALLVLHESHRSLWLPREHLCKASACATS